MIRAIAWACFYIGVALAITHFANVKMRRGSLPDPCTTGPNQVVAITCTCPAAGRCDCTCRVITSRGKQ